MVVVREGFLEEVPFDCELNYEHKLARQSGGRLLQTGTPCPSPKCKKGYSCIDCLLCLSLPNCKMRARGKCGKFGKIKNQLVKWDSLGLFISVRALTVVTD